MAKKSEKMSLLRHEFSKVAMQFERRIEAKNDELQKVIAESNRVLEKQKNMIRSLEDRAEKLEKKCRKKSKACKKLREIAFSDSE